MNREKIIKNIKLMLPQKFRFEDEDPSDNSKFLNLRLKEDLDMNKIAFDAFVHKLASTYCIAISANAKQQWITIGDVVDYIRIRMS